MFCPNCDVQLPDNSRFCSSCGKNLIGRSSTPGLQKKVSTISRYVLSPLKLFFSNPIGGIAVSYERLGRNEALKVGIVFCLMYSILFLIGNLIILPRYLEPGINDLIKGLLLTLGLPVSEFLLISLICFSFNLKGNMTKNLFICGASVLPLGVSNFLSGLLITILNPVQREEIIIAAQLLIALYLFAITYSVLIVYAGLTKILKILETAATISVPIILMAGVYLSEIIFVIFVL